MKIVEATVSRGLRVTLGELADKQMKDASLKECFRKVGEEARRTCNPMVYRFQIAEGVLVRHCTFGGGRQVNQVVVPKGLRGSVLRRRHVSTRDGHLRARQTAAKITEEFFWPRLHSDVR
ncbi:hypothetical protein HPB48_003995 [Haemaphysalis longicornis]|uniref:Integrase zinc-binding domain-containing protein n=1 Tax=Haemaphysalis longicornis TaxID=44386 RepID=A0A9J6GK56_HAELO|nr:hypothetical protein HPB48_003995 [Haemaphysalis longicornis]